MRRLPGRSARILTSSSALAVACALLLTPAAAPVRAYAAPTTPGIQAKKAEAAAASKALADLGDDFEMKVEEYNSVADALEKTRADIVRTRVELEAASARLAEAQDRLAIRARAMYTGGEVDMVAVLIGTTSFDDFLTRLELLNRISTSDASLVLEVSGFRDTVAASQNALENREVEQVALRQEAERKKLLVEAALQKQRSFVSNLNAEVATLIRQEEERQRRIAEELARRAAAEAAARKAAPRAASGTPGAGHPEAVDVALRYLGVPYVWGGSSPSGFDCSGLVQYSYRQIGILLPRTSSQQYHVGAFIPVDRTATLLPGDLVFFGYDGDPERVHHVGMYVGNGNFVHAPATGDRVKVSSLQDRITSRGDYVGAVRP
ncbi:MAG: NlpC/P60 family protein [Coriobacteriia bacterium]|nr:NlpC/P60 family protein [Coriobacteriia bacterium]